MKLNRRHVLRAAATGGVSLLVPQTPAHALEGSGSTTRFLQHFSGKGARELDPLPLITGSAFNGGLRFDDTRRSYPGDMSVCIQPSCRVEDAGRSGETGVLALFHIMALNLPAGAGSGDALTQLVSYLIEEAALDSGKLVYVSTDMFEPHRARDPLLQKGRFVKRDISEAQAAGDGSGFFAPAGHPDTRGFATVSLHYPIGAVTAGELGYPLPGHLEIAEISLAEPGSAASVNVVGGIGLERLALVTGEQAPDFAESRAALLENVRQEASNTGKDLPKGLEAFANP